MHVHMLLFKFRNGVNRSKLSHNVYGQMICKATAAGNHIAMQNINQCIFTEWLIASTLKIMVIRKLMI